ncbi:three-helix bundle dimerization domain-containing protein [Pseudonocardia acidicola]|uniref:DUF3562 domain-containing protein n=1 Tax=Pseudonocardia acidicola TaxID=2724939 RepID=A0ABX1SEJ3_9PSEU|nr:hypothetical protein [Pseudonocardia acidicola]NMH99965.1 hypothetical protein [Pseudonocardia acidicola]
MAAPTPKLSREGAAAGVGEDRVRATVSEAARRFADARVRSFVPILVERAVREGLSSRPPRH